jgi:hypothetical protein
MAKKLVINTITVKRRTFYADILTMLDYENKIAHLKNRMDLARKQLVKNTTYEQAKQEYVDMKTAYKNWLDSDMTIEKVVEDD